MKKFNIFALALLVLASNLVAQKSKIDDPKMDWWKEAKFGMFIHWGLYSVHAGVWNDRKINQNEYSEWTQNLLKIPIADYKPLAAKFNPTKFNAEEFVLLAKEAGMKYMVLTAKHHDGFAMFKSSDPFNIVDATPYKKDVVKALADACKKYGMHFGLYYSQDQDWNHKGGSAWGGHWDEQQNGDFNKYLDEVAVPQVKEILTAYNPEIIWWDTPCLMTPEGAAKFAPILANYPNLIANDRFGGGVEGDLITPEQYIPATGIPGKNWESNMTMNGSWGYKENDSDWKSTETLIRNLIDIASKGGNYLLNVGPTSEGIIPQPSIDRLKEVGNWMRVNGEAIYGTKASPFSQLTWGRVTQKPKGANTILYVSIFEWPVDGKLVIPGLENKVLKAYSLSNKKNALKIEVKDAEKIIDIKALKQSALTTVILLEIKGTPVVNAAPAIQSESMVITDKIVFEITGNTKNSEIRYTTDGTIPTAVSAIAKGTISIKVSQNTTVNAASFVKGKRVSEVSAATFNIEKPLAPAYAAKPGIKYNYYEGIWEKLPNFSKLTPVKSGIVDDFNINERKTDLYYGFTFDGYINVPETDVYTFYLQSDDGGKLIIDDAKILDNDGTHGMDEKRLAVALEKGIHKISMQFFQHGGGQGLKLEWRQAGKDRKMIDKSVLSY